MIERIDEGWVVSCDGCCHSEEIEAQAFDEFALKARGSGWLVTRAGSDWLHECEACIIKASTASKVYASGCN